MEIDFKLIRLQMAAMCLRQHKEEQDGLEDVTIYDAWYQSPDTYLYVTYIVPVIIDGVQEKIKQTFKYFISPEDGSIKDMQKIRTSAYDVVNPEKIRIS